MGCHTGLCPLLPGLSLDILSLPPWARLWAISLGDPAPVPQSWVRSICWLYEQVKEHMELLVLWAARSCYLDQWFSKCGRGSASPGAC